MVFNVNPTKSEGYILINTRRGIKYIVIKKIIFIKSCNKNCIICLEDNVSLECLHLLKYFEANLQGLEFFRCSKSFIINLEFIEYFTYKSIILKGNYYIKLSRKKRQEFFEIYSKFMQLKV